MSVNPLDLQAIFTQMNHVGKQQSLAKESQILRQDHASEQVNKEGEKDANDVPETKDLSEGPGKIKDEEKRKSSDKEEEEENANDDQDRDIEEENKALNKKNKIKDPNLGQKIDIMG